ncbi:MAG: sigma-70 family RNA polymerase sigma factor [Ruminococcus sp.]|nr:sigma-70 family RNA polymerase sigma factor [Ruminococcus sp.]
MTGQQYGDLLRRSKNKAYRAVFDEYSAYVYTIVYNRASAAPKEDIEECVSDIFSDVFFGFDPDADSTADMRSFIGTVAKRAATELYHRVTKKAERTAYMEEEDMAMLPSDHDIEAESQQAALSELLAEKIRQLGEPDSIIIIQKYFYDRNSNQIAKFLSMKPPAVRMRLKRATKRLKAMLESTGVTI